MSMIETLKKVVPIRNEIELVRQSEVVLPSVSAPAAIDSAARVARRQKKRRFGVLLSALICIGIPTLAASAYYFWFASDQFVSEFKFAVRGAERVGPDGLSAMGAGSNPGALLADTFVVTDFINSRQIIDEVTKDVNTRDLFAAPYADL